MAESGTVVVGVDPVRPSRTAVVRAAEQARTRRSRLLLVAVRTSASAATAAAARVLGWAAATARAVDDPRQDVDVQLVDAPDTAETLVRCTEDAGNGRGLLVLGRPAAQAYATVPGTGDLPGGTGRAVLRASHRPVLLVPETPSGNLPATRRGTLLGHDGSPGAWAAAHEAAAEARRCHEPLVLLRSYRSVLQPDGAGHAVAGRGVREQPLTNSWRRELSSREAHWHRQDVEVVAARLRQDHPGLDVRCRIAESSAAFTALSAFAPGMRLVVLGRGGFWAAPSALGRDLVGVLQWSAAPVLVVPPAGAHPPGGGATGTAEISWWNTPG